MSIDDCLQCRLKAEGVLDEVPVTHRARALYLGYRVVKDMGGLEDAARNAVTELGCGVHAVGWIADKSAYFILVSRDDFDEVVDEVPPWDPPHKRLEAEQCDCGGPEGHLAGGFHCRR